MTRPRLLLVPTLTEVEWGIRPLLTEWADVASYDAPGLGSEQATEGVALEAVAERGLSELDRRGWDRCVVVADEFGVAAAVELADRRPAGVQALALGHPHLSFEREGERAPIRSEMLDAFGQLARTDYKSYVRALSQLTRGAYDDEFADRYMERVPPEVAASWLDLNLPRYERSRTAEVLYRLDVPLLLAEHRECLLFTRAGYEDAVAAFPAATTASVEEKPSMSPAFAEALREFCFASAAGG
jgi:hypothetical protein